MSTCDSDRLPSVDEALARASPLDDNTGYRLASFDSYEVSSILPALPPYFHRRWPAERASRWDAHVWHRYRTNRVGVAGQQVRQQLMEGLRQLLVIDAGRTCPRARPTARRHRVPQLTVPRS